MTCVIRSGVTAAFVLSLAAPALGAQDGLAARLEALAAQPFRFRRSP